MSKYNLTLLKQKQYYKKGKFETLEEKNMGNNYTDENIYMATCKDTLKFFRNIGSKQRIKREIKNNVEIIKIYSYKPSDATVRTLHVFTEIKEG